MQKTMELRIQQRHELLYGHINIVDGTTSRPAIQCGISPACVLARPTIA